MMDPFNDPVDPARQQPLGGHEEVDPARLQSNHLLTSLLSSDPGYQLPDDFTEALLEQIRPAHDPFPWGMVAWTCGLALVVCTTPWLLPVFLRPNLDFISILFEQFSSAALPAPLPLIAAALFILLGIGLMDKFTFQPSLAKRIQP